MPSIITHGFVGFTGSKLFPRARATKYWLLSVLCTVVPDADAITFKLGIPYNSAFGHRGFSHSIAFSLLLSCLVVSLGCREIRFKTKEWYQFLTFYFAVTLSHSVLDAITNGGYGVAFFAPIDETRYFFPFRPIKVAPISITRFFGVGGLHVIVSELLWVWLPCILLMGVAKYLKDRRSAVSSK